MGWIKRNLFFVGGGALALLLLGGAGFLTYRSWARNSSASDKLNEIYQNLTSLSQQNPGPGNDKTDNTRLAKEQQQAIHDWLISAGKYFKPVPAIPPGNPVVKKDFADALHLTIDTLKHEAENASVTLPPDYEFSFKAEQSRVQFAPGSLEPLAVQLGEVKAISEVLFSTRINALVGIQRVRVSEDDANGLASDYLDEPSVTNELAVVTPYIVTFRCFTPELARVMSAFATAPNTFIIKSINVQSAGGNSGASIAADTTAAAANTVAAANYRRGFGQYIQPTVAVTPPPATKGGLQTVLKEQLLQVSMKVMVVKLLPLKS